MRKRFIMTAFGKDRPGFIADISQLIYENRCNLEDSTMTNLSDEFAMIFLFEGVEDDSTGEPLEKRLLRECRRLEKDKGISAFVREISPEIPKPKEHTINKTLHVEGLDQAGIVY
ncbi:MAG: amino acid-binding protein, partial [Deltaproteobacteria bacterium]|nr:amino acid-binding protein [Deltaproteobacteria bacterium]